MGLTERFAAIARENKQAQIDAEATRQQGLKDTARYNAYKAAITNGEEPVGLAIQNPQDAKMISGALNGVKEDRRVEMDKYIDTVDIINSLAWSNQ
ncbi:MAG: hypothetical protein U9Q38_08655 [Thermodesulfobacteriota bacterium]|nr:hypothetical protein [Thermodesulfobacteriota bacterium]